MKKIKLISALLPVSIVGSIIPVLTTTGCSPASAEHFEIDDKTIEKSQIKLLPSIFSNMYYIEYTGLKLSEGFDPANLKVQANNKDSESDIVITSKISSTSNNDLSVIVVFETQTLLHSKEAKFDLVFTNKLDTSNKQTISDLTVDFVYATLEISASGTRSSEYLITADSSKSMFVSGEFKAVLSGEVIEDVSNFYIDVKTDSGTTKVSSAEIVPYEGGKFFVKLNLENIQQTDQMLVTYTFRNKKAPTWHQAFNFLLTITQDTSKGFEYELLSDGTAQIIACYLADKDVKIPTKATVKGQERVVSSIQAQAFRYCLYMKSIYIPETINAITTSTATVSAFEYTALENIVVATNNPRFTSQDKDGNECNCVMKRETEGSATPVSVKVGCATSKIPSTVTVIDSGAFEGCLNLTEITIPDSIVKINASAFAHCEFLEKVTLSNSVQEVLGYAFANCPLLKEFNFGESIQTIHTYALANTAIEKISLPASLTDIRSGGLSNIPKLKEISVDENNTKYSDDGCCVYCPSSATVIVGCLQTTIPGNASTIGYEAFSCSEITEINIPANIKRIESFAFSSCYNLTTVRFNNDEDYITINECAFRRCRKLTTINLPKNLTSISKSLFEDCDSLETIEIPSSISSVGNYAFYGCISLKQVSLPDNITLIPEHCFEKCSSLESFVVPANVTEIGSNAFKSCIELANVTFNSKLQNISVQAFANCALLSKVDLSPVTESLKLDDKAFLQCGVEELILPNTLRSICLECFGQCEKLKAVTIPASVTNIENAAFANCTSLETVDLSAATSLTRLYYKLFENCHKLKEVKLSESITFIDTYAFATCLALTSITIPASVTQIDDFAFANCNNLNEAIFKTTTGWKEGDTALTEDEVKDTAGMAKRLRTSDKVFKREA